MLDAWTHTMRGRAVDMYAPKLNDVNLGEVALSLANNCRYNGNVKRFYSVAEHSVLLARKFEELGHRPAACLGMLLHDSPEAYTGDLTWPVQAVLWNASPEARVAYNDMKRRFELLICVHAGLVDAEMLNDPLVHHLDLLILLDERDALLARGPRKWFIEEKGGTPLGVPITGWLPDEAEAQFRRALLRYGVPPERLELDFMFAGEP